MVRMLVVHLPCSLAGEVRLEEVCLAERIGQGASSTVYRVSRSRGTPVHSHPSASACQASSHDAIWRGSGHTSVSATLSFQCRS